jgi:hypothetical protein
MKVIGAGFARTGTSSLQAALEELLGEKCYHMKDIMMYPAQLKMWHDFALGKTPAMDWELLFAGYAASVDCPACIYYKEIMEIFPEAKIILTVRDSQAWWKSFNRLMSLVDKARLLRFFIPKLRKLSRFADKIIIENVFGGRMEKENCINIFERHNQEVREWVPKGRLLEYEVTQGWKPLCDFLGVAIPKKPFPHLNAGKQSLYKLFGQSALKGFK